MNILLLGDIVGRPGRKAVTSAVPRLRRELGLDLVIGNAENASAGVGLTAKNAAELLGCGIDILTTGNHVWKHKDLYPVLDREPRIVRPANYPPGGPGRGWTVAETPTGIRVAVLNLVGRTFMEPVDCPFRVARAILDQIPSDTPLRIVDFHAEATSEKKAMGWLLDGLATAVVGTHTHVQTNDARLLPKGTAYVSDLGMCGPYDSILGMDADIIVKKFTTAMPNRFEVASGEACLEGALLEVDETSGRALSIRAWRE